MVAEYQPAAGKYYYYTTDQVNSTRVVTDDEGNVVYSAAHSPYGGVQQTWVNTFNPGWKFSGKEQDTESALYYFGARYYDPALFRFLSPDPVIQPELGMANPHWWNLYSYCGNNPLKYFDEDGRSFVIFFGSVGLLFIFDNNGVLQAVYNASNTVVGKGNRPFKEGIWKRIGYNAHEGARSTDPIDDTGIYLFDAPANPPGAKGLHAGSVAWWWPTFGCIRTERAAMELINNLERAGDPLKHLIVIWDNMFVNGFFDAWGALSKVEFYLTKANYSSRIIRRVKSQILCYLWNLFGPLNFMYDYFLNGESPIPPDAL